MILVRSRARAAVLLAGLLLPAGVPGVLGVHACPLHGHSSDAPAESAPVPGAEEHHSAPASGHAGHPPSASTDAEPSSGDASCDGLCELLCLSAGQVADPRAFRTATVFELGPPQLAVALGTDRAQPIRTTQLPFVLPLSHAPPSA